jgi:dihydroxy-acid dehydratase
LHISPESAVGGPLAIVRDGDWIELDVPSRTLELLVPEAEIRSRLDQWQAPQPHYHRGYGSMYLRHILQADQGCDFDYLRGTAGQT